MKVDTPWIEDFVDALSQVTGQGEVPLHVPEFSGNEWTYLKDCLDSTFVSSVGQYVDQFEVELAKFTGAKYAVAVVNGTAALHVALELSGVQGNDEVLVPTMTFVATANAVRYCGATPHFVDCETSTLGMDVERLRLHLERISEIRGDQCVNRQTGRVIRAIVPMHTFGHPSDLNGLVKLAHEFKLVLIEDAAEALGSFYQGTHVGVFGRFGVLSFNGNKTITTGGGGALLTNDERLAKHAKHLTTTAKRVHPWEYFHDEVGYNYRMPNINAALGCAQLEQLPKLLIEKRNLYEQYKKSLGKLNGVTLLNEPEGCRSNYWLQTIMLSEGRQDQLTALLEFTNKKGQMTRPIWNLLHTLPSYSNAPRMDLRCAQDMAKSLLNIPSSAVLGRVAC